MPVGKVVAKTGIKKNNKKNLYYLNKKSEVVAMSNSNPNKKKVLVKVKIKKQPGKLYYLDSRAQVIEKDLKRTSRHARAMDGVSSRKKSTTTRRKSTAKRR